MTNKDLVKKVERSIWHLIDNSTAAGKLEQSETASGCLRQTSWCLTLFATM